MQDIINLLIGVFQVLFLWVKSIVLAFIPKKLRQKSVVGKNVLVTGGGSGIGRLMAMKLYKLGANVVLWDINPEGLKSTVEDLKSMKLEGKIMSFIVDVSNRKEVYDKAQETKKQLDGHKVDMLINNAGIVNGKRLMDSDDEKIVKLFEVNTLAHIWTTKAFLPEMLKTNDGHLIYIASVAGLSGGCNITDYCASKYANLGFEESVRYELKTGGYDGIHSSVVCPWFIATGLFAGAKSDIIPFLDPVYTVNAILDGVLANNEVIFVPKMIYTLFFLKSLLPASAMFKLFETLKGTTAMDTFVGRTGHTANGLKNDQPSRAL